MSHLGTSKGVLEVAKFGMYVGVPIFLMYTFANNGKNIQRFMGNRSYIVYPPETLKPLSEEERRNLSQKILQDNNFR